MDEKITIIARDNMKEITVDATMDNVEKVIQFVCNPLKELDFNKKSIMHVRLACEEILVNIVSYAYEDDSQNTNKTMKVKYEIIEDNKEVRIVFEDSGIPFNPLENKDPDITLKGSERKPGGLGIYMTKKIMDDIQYEYTENKNILTVRKKPITK